jgi:hypothetical protein
VKAITIYDVALARGAKATPDGGLSGSEFDRLGLPMFGGCQMCGASIAAYNASPSMTGYLMCSNACIGDYGFPSVGAYTAWETYQGELQLAAQAEVDLDDEIRVNMQTAEDAYEAACIDDRAYLDGTEGIRHRP